MLTCVVSDCSADGGVFDRVLCQTNYYRCNHGGHSHVAPTLWQVIAEVSEPDVCSVCTSITQPYSSEQTLHHI